MASELAKILADFRTQLTVKISAGGTSGSIQSNTDDDGVTIPNGTYYFTIDGDNSQKEYIKCTVTGLNLTDINSVSRQGVVTSGTVREHRVGAIVTVTDFGILLKILDLLDGTTDLDGSNPLKYDADPTITDDKELATKKYADDLAIAGSPKATDTVYGLSKLSTPAVDPLQPISVGDNDTRVPTQDENNAQAGTSGTPSNTNKYVTENDTSNFATITAATISFVAGTKTIADSGSGLATFRAGSSIVITGSASNNGTFTVVSVLAGAIVVAETLTDESAGATVTITSATASKLMRLKSNGKIDATKLEGALPGLDGSALTNISATKKLQINTTDVAYTNSTAETDLLSVSLPAGLLGTGNGIRGRIYFDNFQKAQNSQYIFKMRLGGTQILGLCPFNDATTFGPCSGYIDFILLEAGATNSQDSVMDIRLGTIATDSTAITGATSSVDTTGAVDFKITFYSSVANANNKITAKLSYIELIK